MTVAVAFYCAKCHDLISSFDNSRDPRYYHGTQTEKLRDREERNFPEVTQPVSDEAGIETLVCPTPGSELPTATVCPSSGHTSSDKERTHFWRREN